MKIAKQYQPTHFSGKFDGFRSEGDRLVLVVVAPMEVIAAAFLTCQWRRSNQSFRLTLRNDAEGGIILPATLRRLEVNAAIHLELDVAMADLPDFSILAKMAGRNVLVNVDSWVEE